MADFEFAFDKVILYPRSLDEMLNMPGGEVGQNLDRNADALVKAAKRQVGVKTGALRASIHSVHTRVGRYQEWWIGSEDKIAYMHHEGTRPHEIHARKQEFLRFTKNGRLIMTRSVNHPGTQPNRYLSENMEIMFI